MPKIPEARGASALRDPHPAGRATIFGLQGLRFVAAALVVMTHALNREVTFYASAVPRAAWMEAGVDIFFVISGFIMVYIIKPETRPGPFWLQRFTRIAPLYWVATAVAFLGGLVLPDWFFGQVDIWSTLRSALFLPMGENAGVHPIISPGWTLIYEFAFYTLLTLCMFVRRPPFRLAAAIIIVYSIAGTIVVALNGPTWLDFYGDWFLMLEFIYGMVAAWTVAQLPLKPWQGLVLAGIGFVLIFYGWYLPFYDLRGLKVGLPAFLVVIGVLASEPLWQRNRAMLWFARLGDASYSIYIVHFFFVTALATLVRNNPLVRDALGPYGFIALAMVLGLGSGILAHIYIERPLLALVRGWLPKRRPHTTLATPAKV